MKSAHYIDPCYLLYPIRLLLNLSLSLSHPCIPSALLSQEVTLTYFPNCMRISKEESFRENSTFKWERWTKFGSSSAPIPAVWWRTLDKFCVVRPTGALPFPAAVHVAADRGNEEREIHEFRREVREFKKLLNEIMDGNAWVMKKMSNEDHIVRNRST